MTVFLKIRARLTWALSRIRSPKSGTLPETALKTIDANGLAVMPGFIDVHTHSDPLL